MADDGDNNVQKGDFLMMAYLIDFIKSSKQRILRVFIYRKSLINCSLGEKLIKFCQRYGSYILFYV